MEAAAAGAVRLTAAVEAAEEQSVAAVAVVAGRCTEVEVVEAVELGKAVEVIVEHGAEAMEAAGPFIAVVGVSMVIAITGIAMSASTLDQAMTTTTVILMAAAVSGCADVQHIPAAGIGGGGIEIASIESEIAREI